MHRLRRYSLPYLFWMSIFVLVPTLFLVLLAVSNASLYRFGAFSLSLANLQIFTQSIIVQSLKNSFFYALIVSLVSFLIGYPVAYTLTKLPEKTKRILIALMIFPIIGTELAVFLGLLAMYLPFMIFPIFSVLDKLDPKLIEAAKDLGATDFQTFVRIIFPLSLGGVVSGFIMTFLPSLTAFALPETLGWRKVPMIGMEIQKLFIIKGFEPLAINQGALISLLIMLFSIASFVLITRVDKEGETLI